MAVLESKPFLAPFTTSVSTSIDVLEPATAVEELADIWEPGQRIVLRCRAELATDFWTQTGIPSDETITMVGLATCLPARATWRKTARFTEQDGVWSAEALVEIDGGVVAVEVLADIWIVGPGRTGSTDPRNAVHLGAKLWQLPRPLRLGLESDDAAFPTTALSFAQTSRRDVPWLVEATPEAEPAWRVSSAIRLYVNVDSHLAAEILEGTAAEDIYSLIQSDIHLVVFHKLANWRDTMTPRQMEDIAEHDHETLAALGLLLAQSIGLPLSEAMRMAREEPANLIARSREALRFGAEGEEA